MMARYRTIVFVCMGLAAVMLLGFTLFACVATNEFTQPESVVATQTYRFAQQGTLYYSLKEYPYTVCAYMPIFYTAVAGLAKAGLPVLLGGRLISILALLSILGLGWKLIQLYTQDSLYAHLGLALLGMTQLLLSWGTTGQVDMTAVAFSLAAFYQFSRFHVLGEERLDLAAFLTVAALFTKQTALAAPASIFVLLTLKSPRRAIRFAILSGGIGAVLVVGLNVLLKGNFLQNTIYANMNPLAWYKLQLPLEYVGVVLAPMIVIELAGIRRMLQTPLAALLLYQALALTICLLTIGKVGSDSNYMIESTILMTICGVCSLRTLDFFSLSAIGSKSWVTLLLLPLGLYVVQNTRVSISALASRMDREVRFHEQVRRVKPFLDGRGRVLSVDSNALMHTGRSFEVEPLIYRMLVEAGRIEPTRVLRDIDRSAFETIVLYENLDAKRDPDPEIPRLPADQMDAIRRNYQLVSHVPGPNLSGLYVYRPRLNAAH